MRRLSLAIIVVAAVFSCAALAAASIAPAQKTAICGKRATCAVTALHKAGAASVAELHFGLKDKPGDAPDDGCIKNINSEKKDGGTEYWLLGAKPLLLLALCNDGYGAAGMGEDTVTFGGNRMVHHQEGGSAWRWTTDETFSLSPLKILSTQSCSYNDLGSDSGTETLADEVNFRIVDVAKNPAAHWGDNDGVGCPETNPAMFASPKPFPAPKLVTAFPIPTPHNGAESLANIASGTTVGSCSLPLSTDGKSGFVTFGSAAGPSEAAELRVVSPDAKSVIVQIYDPAVASAAKGASWIGGAHIEVWGGGSDTVGPLKRSDLAQVAVDLDGTIHVVGKADTPKVSHWQAKDERGRPVTVLLLQWGDSSTFAVGMAVSYSQSNGGKQSRLVTTVPMAHGVPVFIPNGGGMQTNCAIRNGRLDIE
jgi:hypothetical protein